MTDLECAREDDLLAAVATGRWPDRADADLVAHVECCPICRDAAVVAGLFQALADEPAPAVPESSAVWLRAQVRARADAARLAERPITVAQAVAFAAIVGVLGALVGAASPWLQHALGWTAGALGHLDPRGMPLPSGAAALVAGHLVVAVAAGCLLLLAPVAVYLAIREP